jgi:RNA 2',3'-cyclic 3'-phosphodiesterase
MRLFVAIELSEEVRSGLLRVRDELKSRLAAEGKGISWVKGENLHVTMKFLGEVPEARVKELCDALGLVGRVGAVELAGAKVVCLPPRGPVRVMAAGLEGDLERLAGVHRLIEERCAEVGYPPEGRKFLPHVTFARVKGRLRVKAPEIERWGEGLFPTQRMEAREFVLMESRLKPQGAEYVRVAGFGIGG